MHKINTLNSLSFITVYVIIRVTTLYNIIIIIVIIIVIIILFYSIVAIFNGT